MAVKRRGEAEGLQWHRAAPPAHSDGVMGTASWVLNYRKVVTEIGAVFLSGREA